MKSCRQGSAVNPDSAWHAEEKKVKNNALYKLMDRKMGGEMVRVFEEEGPEGLRKLCAKELPRSFLYNSGEGKVITLEDYETYRYYVDQQANDDVSVPVEEEQDFKANKFVRFEEHRACWALDKRGVYGETALHLCYRNNTPLHNEVAKILLQMYPQLAVDIVEKEERYGESALHMAIVNGDFDSVKLLVESGANVNQKATGEFFLPGDQKKKSKTSTNDVGYAYYGEYPLAFAACFGHESIYDYLLRHGADPNLQDSYGNTVLHLVIINNQLDMYSYAVRHHVKPANTWIKNGSPGSKDGLTPLSLASKLGRQHIFNEIMELHRIELWRYSNVGCSLYPLHAVDSIGIGGRTNWNSALMIVVNGETDDHLEMLQGGVIKQLLDEKWKTFVRKQFFQRLLLLLLHLVLLTLAVYLRPPHDLARYVSYQDGIRFASEIIVVLGCIGNFLMHIEELKALGPYLFIVNLKNAPSKAVFLMSCLLIFLCLPVRCAHFAVEPYYDNIHSNGTAKAAHTLQFIEETMLIIAVPCAWCMLLFFAKGHSLTGTSVMMFYKILIGDIVRFLIIYFTFLVCFSQAFYFLYKDVRDTETGPITTFLTPHGSMMALIHMTFGEFTPTHFDYTVHPDMTKIVFIIFMLLMPILLLNMLIAMMGNTYMNINAKSDKEWVRQWAKIVMVLERSFSKESLVKFQDQYSVSIDNPPKVDAEHLSEEIGGKKVDYRALMVIKTSSKTMAKQRKDAIAHWKWLLKETRRLIRDVRHSGFEGEITFRHLFPDPNEFSLYDNSLLRCVTTKKRHSYGLLSEGDPDWTAAVQQLAWEKDLNLSAGATSLRQYEGGLTPLDQVDTPPTSGEHTATGPPTECTTMEMDYINDEELEAIIQQAEDYKVTSESSVKSPKPQKSQHGSEATLK